MRKRARWRCGRLTRTIKIASIYLHAWATAGLLLCNVDDTLGEGPVTLPRELPSGRETLYVEARNELVGLVLCKELARVGRRVL
jgi:hypothetical protein